MKSTIASLSLALSLAGLACASGPEKKEAEPQGTATLTSAEVTTGNVDATAIANAETAFNKAIYVAAGDPQSLAISYSALPAKLAREVARNNPSPNAASADRAFAVTVQNASGMPTKLFMLTTGVDVQGASHVLYSPTGRELASGETYRTKVPTWRTTATLN